ncbi:phosphoenolpyruvate--protein phosphotransferase [Paenibacillus terrae]
MSNNLKGIGASAGIAIAKAYRLEEPDLQIVKKSIGDKDAEKRRLEQAISRSKAELEKITEYVNAEFALKGSADRFVSMLESMESEYMRERAKDISDVTKRVIAHLLDVQIPDPSLISEEVVIIAKDLTPSDTAQLNRRYVKGFTTDIGGRTSHSAIMARSMEIPSVVGTKQATARIENGVVVIVDGLEGDVIIDPSSEIIAQYEAKKAKYETQKAQWAKLVHEPTVTKDGVHVELAANIGTPADVKSVLENGGEAVGLYRTEFLYMGRDRLPTEEEQFASYKTVLEKMQGKPVVVRTLDIGGDKELPYLKLPKEMNPFLGFRAIRLCLEEQAIFRTQLRALLRASVYGNLKIMFPMIATVSEFREAKAIPILLSLGLDEFSMSATSILPVRTQIRELAGEQAKSMKEAILSLKTSEEVAEFIKKTFYIHNFL